MTTARFIQDLAEVADAFDAFLIDETGVMHDATAPLPGAVEAMTALTARNKHVVVLTNEPTRAAANMARLERMGFPRSSYTRLVSSGEVIWNGLRTGAFGPPFDAGSRVYAIGYDSRDPLDGLALRFVPEPEGADFLLIAGSEPHASLDELSNTLLRAAQLHVPALCTDPARTRHTDAGGEAGAGAVAAVYEGLGGRVTYVGKPFHAMYQAAVGAVGGGPRRFLCVGDTLDHDVLGGAKAGFNTALVRTGAMAGLDDAAFEVRIAGAAHRPDFVLNRLG